MADLNEDGVTFPRVFVARILVVLEGPELLLTVGRQEQGHWGCLMHVTKDGAVGARLPPPGG